MAGIAVQRFSRFLFDVILVDQRCDGHIEALAERFSQRLDVLYIKRADLDRPYPLASARNAALEASTSEWVVSLDSDSICNPGYLTAAYGCLMEHRTDLSFLTGERIFVSADNFSEQDILSNAANLHFLPRVRSSSNHRLPRDKRFPEIEHLPHCEHPWDYMHGGNVIYGRQLALSLGGYDPLYDGHHGYEDIDFAYRIISTGKAVPKFVNDMYVYHQEPCVELQQTKRMHADHPNWNRVRKIIPGYKEFKHLQYERMGL
ncbi:MAG: glycosyltransferase [Actinomycetota bacterium]|nr:glycosyltransferase [Actinomycetota bacterium]